MSDYNHIEFVGNCSRWLHPEQIISTLRLGGYQGVTSTEPLSLLEVGCSSGGSLIPLAASFPAYSFVGIDPASNPLSLAKEFKENVLCSNLELINTDLNGAPEGPFDIILLHGLYSWCSKDIQETLVPQVAKRLKSGGILHCSHNVSPGWRIRESVWELLRAIPQKAPQELIAAARLLLQELEESLTDDIHFATVILPELMRLKTVSDSYLFHELLNPHTSGTTLARTAETFAEHGLHYFLDTRWSRNSMLPPSPQLAKSRTSQATWHDYVIGSALRESIFLKTDKGFDCLEPHTVELGISKLYGCLSLNSQLQTDSDYESPWKAPSHSNEKLSWQKELLREKLASSWPHFVNLGELVREFKDSGFDALTSLLCNDELFLQTVKSEPINESTLTLLPWVGFQAAKGELVTNGHHQTVSIGGFEQNLINGIAEGRNTPTLLVPYLRDQVPEGGDAELKDEKVLRDIIEQGLSTLKKAYLLSP